MDASAQAFHGEAREGGEPAPVQQAPAGAEALPPITQAQTDADIAALAALPEKTAARILSELARTLVREITRLDEAYDLKQYLTSLKLVATSTGTFELIWELPAAIENAVIDVDLGTDDDGARIREIEIGDHRRER